MRINFLQGIVTFPSSLGQQVFLQKTGNFVTLQTVNGRVDLTFCHGTENYLFTEASTVPNAWGPLLPNTDYWLYWDLDLLTAVRTFGFTTLAPVTSNTAPSNPQEGQHWFDTKNTVKKMFVYQTGQWRNVIRVFAAKVNNNVFTGLGISGILTNTFSGTQIGIQNTDTVAGRIIADNVGKPIRRASGQFFTSEDDFFTNGSPVNVIRLEANIFQATALENVAAYQVAKLSQFGKINLATYNDIQTTIIIMTMENLLQGQAGTMCAQGVIVNPNWNFTNVGAPLWISGVGLLSEIDSHITDPVNYPESKPPVARVISPTSIMFDQGMGGKGERGDAGDQIDKATDLIYGITKLSVPAVNPTNPIAVGDNDPRLVPYVHPATHPATMITATPQSFVTGSTVQTQLQQLINRNLDSISNVVVPTPATNDYLKFNGTNWVNSPIVIPPGGVDHLSELLDVTLTTPVNNEYLRYDGTKWVNSPIASSSFQSIPIEMMNFMGDGLIDAPIDPNNVGRGDTSILESGKFQFTLATATNLDNITNIPAATLLYMFVRINGITDHEISFNSSTTITFQDILDRLNTVLNPFNIFATYATIFEPTYFSTVSIIRLASTNYLHHSIEIFGGRPGQLGTNQSNLILAIQSFTTNMSSFRVINHFEPSIGPTYLNYAGEYYIAGNVPAATPPTPPVFYWNFINQGVPIDASLVLGWPPNAYNRYSFTYNTNYGFTGNIDLDPTVLITLGDVKTYIEANSPFTFTINTALSRIEMFIPFTTIPTQLSTLIITDGSPGVWDPVIGAFAQYTAIDISGTLAVLNTDIYGTPEILYPGVLGHIKAQSGDLVVYNNIGQWKNLGPANILLANKKIGIALNPESKRVPIGTFAGMGGNIITYPSMTPLPVEIGDQAVVVSKKGIFDDVNEKTVLTKVNYPQKFVWLLSDVTTNTTLLSVASALITEPVFNVSYTIKINLPAAVVQSYTIPYILLTNSQTFTFSDLVDRLNDVLIPNGIYCVYQPTTNIVNSYDSNTICFYQTSAHQTTHGTIVSVEFERTSTNPYNPSATLITSTTVASTTNVWETISTNMITYNTRASSNAEFPINSRVPVVTLGGNHTSPHAYCVNTTNWHRTGDFSGYPLNYNEILNLRWALGHETLHLSSSKSYNDFVKIHGAATKTSPLVSIIPLNDSRFAPIMQVINDNIDGNQTTQFGFNSDISFRAWIINTPVDQSLYQRINRFANVPYDGTEGYIFDILVRTPRNADERVVNLIVNPNITPQTNEINYNHLTMTRTQSLVLASIPQKVSPWIEVKFKSSTSKVPFYEPAGVYNTTGLSNDATYTLPITRSDPSGISGFHSFRITALQEVQPRSDTFTVLSGGNGTSLGDSFTITSTFPTTAETYGDLISFFVMGPGTFTTTVDHSGQVAGGIRIYDASTNIIPTFTTPVYDQAITTATPPSTVFTTLLPEQKPYKVVINTAKNSPVTGAATVTLSNTSFVASTLGLTIPATATIDRQTYTLMSPFGPAYDITTIKGLIKVLNTILISNSIKVGWSFNGTMVMQSSYDGTFTHGTGSGTLFDALTALGIEVADVGQLSLSTPGGFLPTTSKYEQDNSLFLAVPLISNEQNNTPSISGNIPGYFDPSRGEII